MTQLDLLTAPCADTLTDKMAADFRRRAGEWVDVADLAGVGGIGGWRTRVSELRHAPYHMVIEWRLERWPDGRNRSRYCYRPSGEVFA